MSNLLCETPHTYIDSEEPDPRPGSYYVSCIDAGRFSLLYGPCEIHVMALSMVDKVKDYTIEHYRGAFWYAYGTCRLPVDYVKPGVLNEMIRGE